MPKNFTTETAKGQMQEKLDGWLFNELLLNVRKFCNYSQETMGEKLGVSGGTISAYETKRMKPSIDVIVKFFELFNVTLFTNPQQKNADFVFARDR